MEACRDALIKENIELLQQLREVLECVTAEAYTTSYGSFRRGGVGKHVRHVLDHKKALLSVTDRILDYEARTRDPDLEQYPTVSVWRRRPHGRVVEK